MWGEFRDESYSFEIFKAGIIQALFMLIQLFRSYALAIYSSFVVGFILVGFKDSLIIESNQIVGH